MDEVTYLVTLLDEYWNTAVAALGSTIPAIHRVKPQIMDIRSMASTRNDSQPGRGGNRIRINDPYTVIKGENSIFIKDEVDTRIFAIRLK